MLELTKQNKGNRMTLLDSMKQLQPLATILASHPHQKAMIEGNNGLTEIVRTWQLHSEEKFFSRVNEHCEHFSDYVTNGCLCAASNAKISH